MEKILSFCKKNLKFLAMGLLAFLSALACLLPFVLSTEKIEVKADVTTYWSDNTEPYAGGYGTETDPYQIASAFQLANLAKDVNSGAAVAGKYYKVTNPIILSAHYWTPIGTPEHPFIGYIDFQNNPVVGMTVYGEYDYAGLFGCAQGISVKNLIMRNSSITLTSENGAAGEVLGGMRNAGSWFKFSNISSQGATITANGAAAATTNGIGGLIGSVTKASAGDCSITNISLKTEIFAPNRKEENELVLGSVIGFSLYQFSSNIDDIIVDVTIKYDTSKTLTIKKYSGDFDGANTSNWFFYPNLNGGVPCLKSQYWVGANKNQTGSEITAQLTTSLGFTRAIDISDFIPQIDTWQITTGHTVSNGNPLNREFKIEPDKLVALPGELITITSTYPEGYSLASFTVNGSTVASESCDIEDTTSVITEIDTFTMPSQNTSITSNFTANEYYITANANGGLFSTSDSWVISEDGTTATKTLNYDSLYGLPTPTRQFYFLTDWKTEAGSVITSDSYFSSANDQILYAQWTEIYTVTADFNGGTVKNNNGWTVSDDGATATKTFTGSSGNVYNPPVLSTRVGYSSYGWRTEDEAPINSSTQITNTTDHTIYASWQANTYVFEYNLNGGTAGALTPTSAEYDSVFIVSNPTKTGYTFAGWEITGMDEVDHYYGFCSESTSDPNVPNKISGKTATVEGYSEYDAIAFKNLSSENYSEEIFGVGVVWLTATWVVNSYRLTLDVSKGVESIWYKIAYSDQEYTKISSTMTISVPYEASWFAQVYASEGYKISEDVSGAGYYLYSGVMAAEDYKLTPNLEARKYTVIANPNLDSGFSFGVISSEDNFQWKGLANRRVEGTVTYDSAYGKLPTVSRTDNSGYEFLGWWTDYFGGTQITESTTVSIANDHTIYAHWGKPGVNETITVNKANTVTENSATYATGGKFGTLAVIDNSYVNYSFGSLNNSYVLGFEGIDDAYIISETGTYTNSNTNNKIAQVTIVPDNSLTACSFGGLRWYSLNNVHWTHPETKADLNLTLLYLINIRINKKWVEYKTNVTESYWDSFKEGIKGTQHTWIVTGTNDAGERIGDIYALIDTNGSVVYDVVMTGFDENNQYISPEFCGMLASLGTGKFDVYIDWDYDIENMEALPTLSVPEVTSTNGTATYSDDSAVERKTNIEMVYIDGRRVYRNISYTFTKTGYLTNYSGCYTFTKESGASATYVISDNYENVIKYLDTSDGTSYTFEYSFDYTDINADSKDVIITFKKAE